MKRYIASDFHNGNDVADYDRVLAFLELVDDDADEFLILGDWEELLFSNMTILTEVEPYSSVTEKVREIARKKPVNLILGNHDWPQGLFASSIEPISIIPPFAEDGVFYTHGHEYDWMSFFVGTPVDPIWWGKTFPILPLHLLLFFASRTWEKAQDIYNLGVTIIHERARAYAAEHGYHTVILGHTHFPTDEVRGGIRLVNTGDMLDSYSHIVQTDDVIELKFFQ
ncbi:unnamed protein product [marine sediment metagenome]|uniref:Calcineurin-like phosphoesterase domain-containing protein n=1 Tax=marine sediment metagenome TaxID=412755 RepID=X1QZ94_9ZZZZ